MGPARQRRRRGRPRLVRSCHAARSSSSYRRPNDFRTMVVCVDGASAALRWNRTPCSGPRPLASTYTRDRDPSARCSRTGRGTRCDRRTDRGPRTAHAQVRAPFPVPAGAIADLRKHRRGPPRDEQPRDAAPSGSRSGASPWASSEWHAASAGQQDRLTWCRCTTHASSTTAMSGPHAGPRMDALTAELKDTIAEDQYRRTGKIMSGRRTLHTVFRCVHARACNV